MKSLLTAGVSLLFIGSGLIYSSADAGWLEGAEPYCETTRNGGQRAVDVEVLASSVGRDEAPTQSEVTCPWSREPGLSGVMALEKRAPLHGSKECAIGPGECKTELN